MKIKIEDTKDHMYYSIHKKYSEQKNSWKDEG